MPYTAIPEPQLAISLGCSTNGTGWQWLNLRYVTRLLVRLGADEDALALHHALVQAGKPSRLGGDQLVALAERVGDERFDGLSGAEAVVRARTALARYR